MNWKEINQKNECVLCGVCFRRWGGGVSMLDMGGRVPRTVRCVSSIYCVIKLRDDGLSTRHGLNRHHANASFSMAMMI
jgi:hypothetical protein